MNLYSHLVSSLALPWVSVLTDSEFWKLHRGFVKRPATLFDPPPQDTLARLQGLVRHVYNSVPFYRESLDAAGIPPESIRSLEDFRRIPIVTKADISANFPDRITASTKPFRPWRYISTSGTIERLTAIHDYRKRDVVRCANLLALHSATGYRPGMKYIEIPPDVCRNVCGATATVDPPILKYLLENLYARKLGDPEVLSNVRGLVETQIVYRRMQLPSYGADGLSDKPQILDQYLEKIAEYRPYAIKALPAYLYALARRVLRNKIRPPRLPGGLMPMGSSITPYMKETVQTAFGSKVHEDYGCAELGAVAAECLHQNGLHPFSALFHVEVVKDGRPARYGEIGKVLITDLYSYAMPFLRYEIGDIAVLRSGQCPCGQKSDRIEVLGRMGDCLPSADGSILPPDTLVDAILAVPGVYAFQLEMREEDDVQVQVVPDGGAFKMSAVKHAVHQLLGERVSIAARVVPAIMPESSGKFRFVKNLSRAAREVLWNSEKIHN